MNKKLIRDHLPNLISQSGGTPRTHVASPKELPHLLKAKLIEETLEVINGLEAKNTSEEIADVVEVLHAIADYQAIAWEKIEKIRTEKRNHKGGFANRTVLKLDSHSK